MTHKTKRLRFVLTLTCLGTVYGGILAFRLLGHQADVVSDVIKLCAIIAVGLLALSAFWWKLITPRISGPLGGMTAALITGICIIPIPTFMGGFKSSFSEHHDLTTAIWDAMKYSISTWSLAEFIALPLCAVTGYLLAK